MKNRLWMLCGLLLLVCGCSETGSREDELTYLRTIMPESLLAISHVDIGTRDSIAVKGESPEQYLGLRVFAGQPKVHGGIRAEVSVDYPFAPEDVVTYQWRFKIPSDFVSDAPANRWWLIGQWHDQPDTTKGESWDSFESLSPPVSISMGELDGQLALTLIYGQTFGGNIQESSEPVHFDRGVWNDIRIEVRWSQGADGYAKVFLNDSVDPVAVMSGPNMNNGFQHYFKFGMYRHPAISQDNWIFIDDLEITTVRESPPLLLP